MANCTEHISSYITRDARDAWIQLKRRFTGSNYSMRQILTLAILFFWDMTIHFGWGKETELETVVQDTSKEISKGRHGRGLLKAGTD